MVSQITWALRSRQKKKIQTSSLEFQKQTATLTQPWSSTLVPFVLQRDPSCLLHLFRSGKTSGWNGENFVKYMTSWLVKYMCFLVKYMTCEIHDLWNTWPGEVFERSCISQVMDFTDFFVKYMTCEIYDSTCFGTARTQGKKSWYVSHHKNECLEMCICKHTIYFLNAFKFIHCDVCTMLHLHGQRFHPKW